MAQSIYIGGLVFILGSVLLLSSILRGRFKIFGAEVTGKIHNPFLRFIAFILGLFFILVAIGGLIIGGLMLLS